ncbi:sugar phosphate isomerase/epimerase family protein [Qingshengfaniella alkalisoli]|uniref:Sugar phosphate isomerase/epimerase n=1 Tax=Qingshengfaniella alkalisoli TaxID=2599296 RepID=A0A5B8I6B1_9RHOB|nr:sugar phosphate isomerase/epimerase [Qingshengfaniella alkalisoli]QDY69015.1 sugar phosphate isomerase/epimerase [Qingshengfaniella alkalisoli]
MTDFSYQLYSSRNFPPLSDTLAMLAGLGYKQVEGFGGLYANLDDLDALKEDLTANDLHMATGHVGLEMMRDESARILAVAEALNMKAVFVPAIGPDQRSQKAADWEKLGKDLAEIGKPYWDSGLTFGWHNHDFEFATVDSDDKPLDLILQGSDQLALELDVAWVVRGGEDPLKWIDKYADRIVAAHLKDIAPEGDCTDEDGWADLGQGVMDWKTIMATLREKTKAQFFVMEHDNPSDHKRFASRSIEAAKQL